MVYHPAKTGHIDAPRHVIRTSNRVCGYTSMKGAKRRMMSKVSSVKPSVAQTALFTIKLGFVIFMRAPVLLTLFGVSWTLLFCGKALQRAFDFCHKHLPVAVRPRLHQCGDEDATATLEAQLAITPSSSAHSPNTPTPPAKPDKTTDSVGVGSGDLFGSHEGDERELLEELDAVAEGWRMRLQELDDEASD